MAEKLYNLKVKNGTYMKDGEEKQNYLAVGVVLKGDYGPYMILDKTFNPAGIETDLGKTGISISMFKDEPRQAAPKITPPAAKAKEFVDDDLPDF
jgi:hypothetical protein